ncbi:MAG: molybdate ABC transporter substrate-binding protein [Verrucomicrobiales bacterium]|nr:molybdate ABC transporter substrate-binding protein [Verrucomicrobiales bacterium]
MKTASRFLLITLLLAGTAALLLARLARPPRTSTQGAPLAPLLLYCAAGLKAPVSAAVADYERRFGVRVEIQYGGSGTLLSNLRVARRGDLFLAADTDFLTLARTNGLLREVLPVASIQPVVAVARGNPKSVRTLADLQRSGVAVALANPDAAAIGRLTRSALLKAGVWTNLSAQARVFKPTVNDVANDVKLGAVDAGIVWDATLRQYPELEGVPVPEFAHEHSQIAVGILDSATSARAALHFARFLAASDAGLPHFQQAGYQVVEGDPWVPSPSVVLYSGGVNRMAIEDTLRRFEEREGVQITRVYNGCGILTSQIRAGQRPDAYFACDVSFMTTVQEYFQPSTELAETRMVILTKQGNPRQIRTLADLAAPSLRVGVANAEQSALGALTARLLRELGLDQAIQPNIVVQTPTADLLVNQVRAGGLDAAVVYQANTSQVLNSLHVIPIESPAALAIQPFAIARSSRHTFLMSRLLEALASTESRLRFEQTGFAWRAPTNHFAP